MVERCVRDAEAAGSNPVTSTISSVHKEFNFMNTFLFILFGCALNITEILFTGGFSPEISAHTKTPKNEIID